MNAEIAIGYIIWLMFFVVSTRDILYYLWLFQVKEYRIDRLRSYIKEYRWLTVETILATIVFVIALPFIILSFPIHSILILLLISFIATVGKEKRALFSLLYFICILILAIFSTFELFLISLQIFSYVGEIFFKDISYIEYAQMQDDFLIAISFLFLFSKAIKAIKEIYARSIKRPKITPKIILIFVAFTTILAIQAVIPAMTPTPYTTYAISLFTKNTGFTPAFLVALNLAIPLIILFSVLTINPLSNWQKRKILRAATEKRKSLKHIKTIGITGSYGKTSTKEFLYAILSQKYKVVKTEGNNNTAIGVANTVLRKVSDDFDFFICEMGAYKIGEIKEICEISQPEIGIITGINEQHIELFGSIENTKRAKFELAQSLPQNSFAVINQKALAMPPETPFKAETVAFSKELIKDLAVYPDYITFQYKDVFFRLNALGKHYSENLLAAIITAEKIGMTLEEINEAILKISLRDRYIMQKVRGPQGAVFIDDSYSANPDGVMAALDYLEDAYGDYKKIFVFPGIIELGKKSENIHQRIWERVNEVCETAYLIQKENKKIIQKYPQCQFVFEKNFDIIAQMLTLDLDEKTVVLFESRGAGVVMNKILNQK